MPKLQQYNLKSPSVKRIMKEASELREPTEDYFAQPLEENLFEWHFTIRGPSDSCYDKGIYHGKIILPTEYPMKPPSIIIFTPNGRFKTNNKICLTISGHHPESWQPSWSIRTALLAIIGYMTTENDDAIGYLKYTEEERRTLAIKSNLWSCSICGKIKNFLIERKTANNINNKKVDVDTEDKKFARLICFKNDVQDNSNVDDNILEDDVKTNNDLTNKCNSNLKHREPIKIHNKQNNEIIQTNETVQTNQILHSTNINNVNSNIFNSILTSSYFMIIIIFVIILLILRRLIFI